MATPEANSISSMLAPIDTLSCLYVVVTDDDGGGGGGGGSGGGGGGGGGGDRGRKPTRDPEAVVPPGWAGIGRNLKWLCSSLEGIDHLVRWPPPHTRVRGVGGGRKGQSGGLESHHRDESEEIFASHCGGLDRGSDTSMVDRLRPIAPVRRRTELDGLTVGYTTLAPSSTMP